MDFMMFLVEGGGAAVKISAIKTFGFLIFFASCTLRSASSSINGLWTVADARFGFSLAPFFGYLCNTFSFAMLEAGRFSFSEERAVSRRDLDSLRLRLV